jgi:hypothetical protein
MQSLKSSPIKLTGIYATDAAAAQKEIISLLDQANLSHNIEKLNDRSKAQWENHKYGELMDAATSTSCWGQRQVKGIFLDYFVPNATIIHVSDSGENLGAIIIGIKMAKPHRDWYQESLFDNGQLTVDISFITSALSKTIKDDTTGFDGFLKKTNFRQLNKPANRRYSRYGSSNSAGTNPSKYFARTCLKHTEAPHGYFTSEAVINKKAKTLSLARVANMACLFKTISDRKTKIDKLGSKSTVNIAKMNVEVSIIEALNDIYGEGQYETTDKTFNIDDKIMNATKPFTYNITANPKMESSVKHGSKVQLSGMINLEKKEIEIGRGSTHRTITSNTTNEYGFETKQLKDLMFSNNKPITRMAIDLINKTVGVKKVTIGEAEETMLLANPEISISFKNVEHATYYGDTSIVAVIHAKNTIGANNFKKEATKYSYYNPFSEVHSIKYDNKISYSEVGNIFKDITKTQIAMFSDFKKL